MISTTNKKYSPVSYRRPTTTTAVVSKTTSKMTSHDDNNSNNKVKSRSAMFEELAAAAANPQPKKIPIMKGWMADMEQAQGNKYGRRVVGFSTLPPKRSLADLP